MKNEFDDSFWAVDTPDDAIQYLDDPAHFVPFSKGLTELMIKCGYQDSDDTEEKVKYLWKCFSAISDAPVKNTLRNWFQYDQSRPKRTHKFQICFALSASLENVRWFFDCVCWERGCNCHNIKEAVYYYCLLNRLPYAHVQKLISIIDSFPDAPLDSANQNIFTGDIEKNLDQFQSDEEFLDYFRKNKNIFDKWNKSAARHIRRRQDKIKGKDFDRELLRAYIEHADIPAMEQDKCGLVIQEYILNVKEKKPDNTISGKTVSSTDFMLERILGTRNGIPKKAALPQYIREHFPSSSTFSNIIKELEDSQSDSYDAIRKCLILLEFYYFWATERLKPNTSSENELFDEYCDRTNYALTSCGYGKLFSGNPYDWLFLWAAATKNPLDSLRDVINLAPNDE